MQRVRLCGDSGAHCSIGTPGERATFMNGERIHLFLNPTAGRGRAAKRQASILQLFEQAAVAVELHNSRSVGDLETQVLQHVDAGASRIVVAGGDGSIHEAVNGILRADSVAALGIIPTGTGNDFAKACDIPLDWEHATRLLAERVAADALPRTIDAGQCNERYFANGAGIGFDAKVTTIAQSIRLPIGDLVYLLATFRALIPGVATPNLRLMSGDFTWEGPLTLASICNGPWLGGMFHIAPMGSNSDEQLELVIARPVTRRRVLALLPKLMNGTHLDEPEVLHMSVRELTISADQPLPSHLDGEVQPLQSVFKIALLPGVLRLL